MVNTEEVFARISDAPWAGESHHVTIGGAGGLGSWVALFLARIGHGIRVYDNDTVGIENIGGGQFFKYTQAGRLKTESLRTNINEFVGPSRVDGYPRFSLANPVSSITICTFDNMESRRDMLQTWLANAKDYKEHKLPTLFLNVSMLPEGGFIEVIDRPSRANRWLEEWVPSDQMPELACSFKATTHNAALMAAYAINLLNSFLFNRKLGEEFRHVPYKTIVDLNLMMLESHEK